MFLSGFFRCIDADQTDCGLKTVLSDRDRVAICDPCAFVLGGKNNDRKYYDGNDEGRNLKSFCGHQDAFQALLQIMRLMVEGVTPYFWASCS